MRLSEEEISQVFNKAIRQKAFSITDDTSVCLYDLDLIETNVQELKRLFPDRALHAIAVKACPIVSILKTIQKAGAGAEVASLPELYIAQACGFSPQSIVFDSPVKSESDLTYAIANGVHLNADSLDELSRIDAILNGKKYTGTFGIRINPQVGIGKIALSSVAGQYSKFGVPLNQFAPELQSAFLKYDWLTGVHIHIGSQGCPLELLVKGIDALVVFANEINVLLKRNNRPPIATIDIGGGLPVAYRDGDSPPAIAEYRDAVLGALAKLDDSTAKLITEFGRYVFAHAGWVASRVEYVKREKNINTAMIHSGADMFVRRCYRPEDWHHDIFVADKEGIIKAGQDTNPYVIAGPLCFSGDILADRIYLPAINEGDYIIIRDAGAYTVSMWSRYNSRCMPKITGYRRGDDMTFTVLKKRETPDSVVDFWS